ncbi:MAG: hypothetical protein LBI27_08795 [Clostridiales bacterium]|jgi:hypothetical protein|nr:hypothetical protein [Clostridiales bacterium]
MNNNKIFIALAWREFVEGKRLLLPMIFPIICVLSMPFMFTYSIFNSLTEMDITATADSLKNFYAVNQMFFIAPMLIPFIGVMFFSRMFIERNEKTIAVLMAMQIKPQTLWKAKVFMASCFSGAIYLACCAIFIISIRVAFGVNMYFSMREALSVFILSPVIGFTLSVFIALLHWAIKKSEMITILSMAITICGVMPLTGKLRDMVITFPVIAIILLVSVAVFLLCVKIIAKIPNEYTANL